MATSIALAEANLPSALQHVDETGAEFVVTAGNRSCSKIAPIPEPASSELKAAGALAGKKPKASRAEEKAAYQKALEKLA